MTKDKDEKMSSTDSGVKPKYELLADASDSDESNDNDPNSKPNSNGIIVSETKKIVLTAILCYVYMLANIAITVLIPFFTVVVSPIIRSIHLLS